MTPHTQMQARGIDTNWTALQRSEAHRYLAEARESTWRAEWYFDLAERELKERGPFSERCACDWLDLAFRCVESAIASRRYAKGSALLATRGRFIEDWTGKTAGRAEARRQVLARAAWVI